jgi:hypothetical protein
MNKYVLTISGLDRRHVFGYRYDVVGFESNGSLADVKEELAKVLKEEQQSLCLGHSFINWYGRRHYIDDAEIKIYTWDDYWVHISQ